MAVTFKEFEKRGVQTGIITRNLRSNIKVVLRKLGLECFFSEETVIGRELTPPKPNPKAVFKLLDHWEIPSSQALIIGDYLHDLQAGRRAGIATIFLDRFERNKWYEWADLVYPALTNLLMDLKKTTSEIAIKNEILLSQSLVSN